MKRLLNYSLSEYRQGFEKAKGQRTKKMGAVPIYMAITGKSKSLNSKSTRKYMNFMDQQRKKLLWLREV